MKRTKQQFKSPIDNTMSVLANVDLAKVAEGSTITQDVYEASINGRSLKVLVHNQAPGRLADASTIGSKVIDRAEDKGCSLIAVFLHGTPRMLVRISNGAPMGWVAAAEGISGLQFIRRISLDNRTMLSAGQGVKSYIVNLINK